MPRNIIRLWCIAGVVAACTEGSPSITETTPKKPRELPLPNGLVVSDVTSLPTLPGSATSGSTNVAYISAASGTFRGVSSAVVRNQTRGGGRIAATVVDGGFDPVVVRAEGGDDLSLEVGAQSEFATFSIKVPARQVPAIVRISPSDGQSDVELKGQIIVVFSEPIDEATVTGGSLALARGATAVLGTVRASADRLSVIFTPQDELVPEQSYQVAIATSIRDLDGEQLERGRIATFTTSADPTANAAALTGVLAFVSTREGVPHIYVANADGSEARRLTNRSQAEVTPAWSRDGKQLAFGSEGGIYVINRDGSGLIRLPVDGHWPSWSPDGKRLMVGTSTGLRVVAADGSTGGEVTIAPKPDGNGWFAGYDIGDGGGEAAKWSPDGSRIAFSTWTNGNDFYRAFIMNIDGSGTRTFVGPQNGAVWDECGPVWSPDGSRIALLGGVFGGTTSSIGTFAVGIVDPETGKVTPILVTGTTCWDDSYSSENSLSGVAWSPDQKSLAITKRSPSWNANPYWHGPKEASIAIVDIATKAVRAVIPDAYDPSWSRAF